MGRTSTARERILSSALGLFHERGYANVGVEDIMRSADVGKSSFYHFFPSKEALGVAVLDVYIDQMDREVFDQAFSEDVAPLDRFFKLIEILSGDNKPLIGCLGGNGAAEHAHNSEALRKKTKEFFEHARARFAQTFDDAIADMSLLPNAPPEQLATACIAYIQGLLLMTKLTQSWDPMRDLGPMIANIWHPYLV